MEPRRANPANMARSLASGDKSNFLSTALVVLLLITSILASAYLVSRLAATTSTSGAVNGKQYQALFLSNGQVYFGRLSGVDKSYVKLKDIYYLQVQQQVQPGQQQQNNQQQPNVSLAKLGGELHGPEDTMYVSRDQVLFWENLKTDGKVAKAIEDYKKSGK